MFLFRDSKHALRIGLELAEQALPLVAERMTPRTQFLDS
jgi:hypothetical protein